MLRRIFWLVMMLSLTLPAEAGLFDKKPSYLTAAQAFAFSSQQQNQMLNLHWQIADGYYLYRKSIQIQAADGTLGEAKFPAAESYQDQFFGTTEIYKHQLDIAVPVKKQDIASVTVEYQGCTQGFCYPPERVELRLNEDQQAVTFSAKNDRLPQSEQDQIANQLSQHHFSLYWFFILGIGLAFTPCVLPMLPLLSACVIGGKQRPNTLRALLLSVCYVQGMALTYTLLGLIVAAVGLPFQVALQSPSVLIGLSCLFVLLALSMFGLFELQLPQRWQQKLHQLNQKQQGGSLLGVFVMGIVAGLVASPCTTAPLSGVLLYVAQSGDLVTGGLALYLLALGMGLPLVLITVFGNRILPKSGAWLLKVKTLFGFVLLALPVLLISRVFNQIEPLLWSALAVATLFWLFEQCRLSGWSGRGLRFVLLLITLFAAKPWLDLAWQTPSVSSSASGQFVEVNNLAELQTQLTNSHQTVMLDLYADWCVACKEFESITFADPAVKQQLAEMRLIRINMSENSPQNSELMQHFQVQGLPTLLFFDKNGQEIRAARITGFLPPAEFLDRINHLN